MKIDSHIHFWKYNPLRDTWITDEMPVLKHDFGPSDLMPQLAAAGIGSAVLVQADQSEAENDFLLDIAKQHTSFDAVVGWVDFKATDIEDKLAHYASFSLMKGFRHIVQSEPDLNFLMNPEFCRGIAYLARYGLTYDVLIYPQHLAIAEQFCRTFSNQKLVIDHLAKPDIKGRNFAHWEAKIKVFKPMEHVYCKLAGLVTEADWEYWRVDDFKRVIDVCLEVFGPERIMFGSDWPVCLLGASYPEVCDIINSHISDLSVAEQEYIWGQSCQNFYNISINQK